jgi:hypothetical protein
VVLVVMVIVTLPVMLTDGCGSGGGNDNRTLPVMLTDGCGGAGGDDNSNTANNADGRLWLLWW